VVFGALVFKLSVWCGAEGYVSRLRAAAAAAARKPDTLTDILSVTFLILRRTERDIMINVRWSSCEVS